MKYKLLLAGQNQIMIDDFFKVMDNDFECLTTSTREMDMINHINFFEPDAFVYCVTQNGKENNMKVINALETVNRTRLKLVLIGDRESCDDFMDIKPEIVSLVLLKPTTAGTIKEEVIKLFEKEKQWLVEQEIKQFERIEQEKEKEREKKRDEEKNTQEPIVTVQPVQRKKEEPVTGNGETRHILVIDDDPMMLKLIKEQLKEQYNVATAVSGKIAFKFLENRRTDLILLDYEMPEENGPEVLKKLRKNDRTKDIPVVFLTGINDSEKIKKVLAMNPQGYLLKPIECDKLIHTIRNLIG